MLAIGIGTMCISSVVLMIKNINDWKSQLSYALARTIVMVSIFAYFITS